MNCSTPCLPVPHHLPEFSQTHGQWVGDAIQPSHPLSSPSPLALKFSQHQGLFQWVGSSHLWPFNPVVIDMLPEFTKINSFSLFPSLFLRNQFPELWHQNIMTFKFTLPPNSTFLKLNIPPYPPPSFRTTYSSFISLFLLMESPLSLSLRFRTSEIPLRKNGTSSCCFVCVYGCVWSYSIRNTFNICLYKLTLRVVVIQLLSYVWFFDTAWTVVLQASLSFTISQSLLKLMFIELVMPSNRLILCHTLLLLPSIFPSIRVFSNESAPRIRWQKYWRFSFSISPSNEYSGLISFRIDWIDLLALKGLQKSSSTPQFESINSLELSLLYGPTLTSKHGYWKNHSFDYMNLC